MKVSEAVRSRHSVRAFLDRPVEREVVDRILERAARAPSGGNLQPWHVYVLGGSGLSDLVGKVANQLPEHPMGQGSEYQVYPPNLKEPYRSRRFKCGEDLYASIGIERSDRAGRISQFASNFRFFGAPVAMFFAADRDSQEGQWSDLGMYIQTIMLLAREEGLHTCAQESWAGWYQLVGDHLSIPAELMLFCGLAIGYRDDEHPINSWRTDRADSSEYINWHWDQ